MLRFPLLSALCAVIAVVSTSDYGGDRRDNHGNSYSVGYGGHFKHHHGYFPDYHHHHHHRHDDYGHHCRHHRRYDSNSDESRDRDDRRGRDDDEERDDQRHKCSNLSASQCTVDKPDTSKNSAGCVKPMVKKVDGDLEVICYVNNAVVSAFEYIRKVQLSREIPGVSLELRCGRNGWETIFGEKVERVECIYSTDFTSIQKYSDIDSLTASTNDVTNI